MEETITNTIKDTSQKIAIIIGQTSEENILGILAKYEAIFSDPTLSVRYFYFSYIGLSTAIDEHYR